MSGRLIRATASILLIATLTAQQTLATSVTPVKYGKWRQDHAHRERHRERLDRVVGQRAAVVDAPRDPRVCGRRWGHYPSARGGFRAAIERAELDRLHR